MQFAQYVALALALAAGLATADPIPQPGTSDAHVGTLADRVSPTLIQPSSSRLNSGS